ncbi:hypothetical protein RUM43_010620 [Polyplax serrata]|uniref:Uncharacterized protein n=1 Tax=Polyplax serrata TaxID=468196 RepID=A0AAN8S7C0_POLSC
MANGEVKRGQHPGPCDVHNDINYRFEPSKNCNQQINDVATGRKQPENMAAACLLAYFHKVPYRKHSSLIGAREVQVAHSIPNGSRFLRDR